VDEHVDAPVGAGLHDGVALANFIRIQQDVGGGTDGGGVFLRRAGDQKDVVAAHLADLVKAGLAARNGLTHDDRLDIGVRGERGQLGNGGFHLGHEGVGVGVGNDVLRVLILLPLRGAELFFVLRSGAGQDGDLIIALGQSGNAHAQDHHKNEQHCQRLLHVVIPSI